MAYHFRKLRQTLRLIPSSKTIGFSTRVNEGDQPKNTSSDGFSSSLPANSPAYSSCNSCNTEAASDKCKEFSNLERSFSDSDLFGSGCNNLPLCYEDIVQLFLPKPPPDGDLGVSFVAASQSLRSLLKSVKAVQFTSDDILVQRFTTTSCDNLQESPRTSPSTDVLDLPAFFSDKIPVSVLTENYLKRYPTTQKDLESAPPAVAIRNTTQIEDNRFVLNNQNISSLLPQDKPDVSCFERDNIDYLSNPVFCSSAGGPTPPGNDKTSGPSHEQLHDIRPRLENLVTKLFSGRHDYGILHKNVVLENNLHGDNKTCVGVMSYALELMKIRLRVHARFSNTSVEILSVTTLENNGIVRIHWRLKGVSQIQLLKFWRLFQTRDPISKADLEWMEAFSYFHIGKDGLVHKHRIDRMMPDNETETDKLTDKLRGLLHQPKPLVT